MRLGSLVHALRRRLQGAPYVGPTLYELIAPEIAHDALARWLTRLAAHPDVQEILEVGASSGLGSTAALLAGALRNPNRPTIRSFEISMSRCAALRQLYRGQPAVQCYRRSSVRAERFASAEHIAAFCRRPWWRKHWRTPSCATLLSWREQDLEYLRRHQMSDDGIRRLQVETGIPRFDLVLLDGSEFTAAAELEDVYGAHFLVLDDIHAFKNHATYQRLCEDEGYTLLDRASRPRYGYAVFQRRPPG